MNLSGKTALITGGAIRVGKAITLALAGAGANVVINYASSAAEAAQTAAEAEALGVAALPCQADVSDPAQVQQMVAQAQARFGAVDVLVNSASLFRRTPLPMAEVSDWRRVLSVGLDGAFYCANAVAPQMLAHGAGAIINIVDVLAWQPVAGFGAHSVGKAGLLALTRHLALELAPAVRVNAVAPGLILPPPGYSAARIKHLAERTLLKRWGAPEDVARAALFLIQSDYITGDCITVDGGERYGRQ
jgi:NAD(P)-dependent dehydrogenase (short-subunit alcohol dehydrogenase family)